MKSQFKTSTICRLCNFTKITVKNSFKNILFFIDAAAILEVLRPPTFVQQPQNTVALEKGDVTMDCEVTGHPQPIVQWYKNGDLIIESEYFQMVRGQSLKILGLVGLDAGIYQCVATNIAGNVQSAAELRVMKKLGKLLSYIL